MLPFPLRAPAIMNESDRLMDVPKSEAVAPWKGPPVSCHSPETGIDVGWTTVGSDVEEEVGSCVVDGAGDRLVMVGATVGTGKIVGEVGLVGDRLGTEDGYRMGNVV